MSVLVNCDDGSKVLTNCDGSKVLLACVGDPGEVGTKAPCAECTPPATVGITLSNFPAPFGWVNASWTLLQDTLIPDPCFCELYYPAPPDKIPPGWNTNFNGYLNFDAGGGEGGKFRTFSFVLINTVTPFESIFGDIVIPSYNCTFPSGRFAGKISGLTNQHWIMDIP